MVCFLNAGFAETAVLGPRGFGDAACGAEVARVEEEVVVGIGEHGLAVAGAKVEFGGWFVVVWGEGDEVGVGRDGGRGGGAEVEEVVREGYDDGEGNVVNAGEGGEKGWQHEDFAAELEGDEEDLEKSDGDRLGEDRCHVRARPSAFHVIGSETY